MVEVRFNGAVYDCGQSETVLEALLRQDAAVPFSCRNGICLTCMMRRRGGSVPRLDDHLELKVWRVYLCGYPPMVKAAFLMGASLADIHADPFELQDLRSTPRD